MGRHMAKRVFYSLDFERDHTRTRAVRNLPSVIAQPAVSAHDWDYVARQGGAVTRKWIDARIEAVDCVIVLIGSATSTRSLVRYEIAKAWSTGKGLLGIYVHSLHDMYGRPSLRGPDPFDKIILPDGLPMSRYVPAYEPQGTTSTECFNTIASNLAVWVDTAVRMRAAHAEQQKAKRA